MPTDTLGKVKYCPPVQAGEDDVSLVLCLQFIVYMNDLGVFVPNFGASGLCTCLGPVGKYMY